MGLQRDAITAAASTKTHHLLLHPSPPILERSKRIKIAAELGLARSSRGRHWSRSLLLHRTNPQKKNEEEEEVEISSPSQLAADLVDAEEKGVEAEEIEVRVRVLQRLIPGGEVLGVERLFEETADYIEALQGQVSVMKTLAGLLNGFERKKRMMVG